MQKYIPTNELILNKTQNLEKQPGTFVKKTLPTRNGYFLWKISFSHFLINPKPNIPQTNNFLYEVG